MSDDGGERMNKAQRLALAAEVAPVLRASQERLRARVVKVYDQHKDPEAKSAKEIDGITAAMGLLATMRVEFDVADGKGFV